ncbi:MAG: carboxypeptidase regulatory-like domain-containing protein [Clostridia bacterium]|nr:carboxypeptidase regulatory-like domain-containing protein [Clostridia bacterium]
MKAVKQFFCFGLALIMLFGTVACNKATDSGVNKAKNATKSSEVNPVTKIAAKPEKPWQDPSNDGQFGAAAPEWLRDAEMYIEANYNDMFLTSADYETWGQYFDLCLGTWSGDVEKFENAGMVSGSYFDPYHVYNHEELAIVDTNGNGVRSDYASDTGNPLYLVCHNSDKVLDWAKEYVDNCIGFGANGMFYDDIRMPYNQLRDTAQTCNSTKHKHVLEGSISHNFIQSTVKELYKHVKIKNPNYFVALNGGVPMASPETEDFALESLWKYSDALMWEHFLYDANGKRWIMPGALKQAAERLSAGIKEGKAELILSYSYDKMDAEKALRAVQETLVFCRLYDLAWSDYAAFYANTSISDDVKKRIYSVKTGPAGSMGTYFGTVVEEGSNAPIAGVTVSADSVSTVTDANGNFRITMPVNRYNVSLSKEGYTATEAVVKGYQCQLTMKKESGTIYYVSNFGSNDNDGLTPKKPFKSLNYAEATGKLQPGDTVVVMEGIYKVPEQTVYTAKGTAEKPINYVAKGEVVIRIKGGKGNGIVLNGDYTSFNGFTFEGSEQGIDGLVYAGGEGVELKKCLFRDTAYYTEKDRKNAKAAVTLAGKNCSFHHNILAGDLFADTAVSVQGENVTVVNNTFDGSFCVDGQTATAVTFEKGCKNLTVKSNIFTNFDQVYAGYSANLGTFEGNIFSKIKGDTTGYTAPNDRKQDDLRFMYAPFGDYGLKSDSIAVNSGVDTGFAFRGEAPDVGAKESKYSAKGYDAVTDENGCIYRVFADSVVIMNLSQTDYTVTVPTGRAGVQVKNAVTDEIFRADGAGNLHVMVEQGSSVILQAR